MKEALEYFNYDELAATVWKNKYAAEGEVSPKDTIDRVVREFYKKDNELCQKYEYNKKVDKTKLSYYGSRRPKVSSEYLHELMDNFKFLVPQGSILSTLGTDKPSSLSNCFFNGIMDDDMESIYDITKSMAQIGKRRGGTATDVSHLRPRGAKVNNSAEESSGPISFMELVDTTGKIIGQAGRKLASMVSIDIRHPDVIEFATVKKDLTKITNANLSIKISKDFLNAVETDSDYYLRFPIYEDITGIEDKDLPYNELTLVENSTGSYYVKRVRAKELWNLIITTAHQTAEPGLLFWDNVMDYSPDTVYPQYRAEGTNPSLAKGTKVITKGGVFPIEELEGKRIEVYNSQGEEVYATCKLSGVEKNVYTIYFDDGTTEKATSEHKWKLIDGTIIETKDLKKGMKIPNNNRKFLEKPKNYQQVRKGILLGLLYGDVEISENSIKFYIRTDGHSHIHYLMLRDVLTSVISMKDWGLSQDAGEQDRMYVEVSDRKLFDFYDQYTDLQNMDGLAKTLFSEVDDSFTIGFIQGLSACAGVPSKDKILFTLQDKTQSKDLVDLFGCYGVKSVLSSSTVEINDLNALRDYYYNFKIPFNSFEQFHPQLYPLDEIEWRDYKQYVEVETIEYGFNRPEPVWDITVDNDDHTFSLSRMVTGNCSEISLSKLDSCRLMAMNLYSFVDKPFTADATFSFTKFYEVTYESMRQMDNLVDLELDAIEKIMAKIEDNGGKTAEYNLWKTIYEVGSKSRRTGLGFTALTDTLTALGYRFGSEDAIHFIETMMMVKMQAELDCTIDLAIIRGTFDNWNPKQEYLENGDGANPFYENLKKNFPEQVKRMNRYGRRNVSWSTISPTGSVSIMTQTSSGCEPVFKCFYTRRVKLDKDATDGYTFVDPNTGDKFKEFLVIHPKLRACLNLAGISDEVIDNANEEELKALTDKYSIYLQQEADKISYEDRLNTLQLLQQYTTHSISTTVNLPENISVETVQNLYSEAAKRGIKGITVYREGSRAGVLVSSSTKSANENGVVRRPKSIAAHCYKTKVRGKTYNIFIGLLENKPYEIFVVNNETPLENSTGEIIRIKKRNYEYVSGEIRCNLFENIDETEGTVTRLLSTMLRHNIELKFIVEQLNKIDSSVVSFNKSLARILSKYTTDVRTLEVCPECGQNLKYEAGCSICESCGYSKCN